MIFQTVSLIQEGESVLFYRFNKQLKGYMIAGVFISPTIEDRMNFAKVWEYFVSEVVRADDIYCSKVLGAQNSMFDKYLHYYDTIDGLKIYKIDNVFRDKHSQYARYLEVRKSG